MKPAHYVHLSCAHLLCNAYALFNLSGGKRVRVVCAVLAVERAHLAAGGAHVGVVHVVRRDKRDVVSGKPPPCRVRGRPERVYVFHVQQVHAVLGRELLAGHRTHERVGTVQKLLRHARLSPVLNICLDRGGFSRKAACRRQAQGHGRGCGGSRLAKEIIGDHGRFCTWCFQL